MGSGDEHQKIKNNTDDNGYSFFITNEIYIQLIYKIKNPTNVGFDVVERVKLF